MSSTNIEITKTGDEQNNYHGNVYVNEHATKYGDHAQEGGNRNVGKCTRSEWLIESKTV